VSVAAGRPGFGWLIVDAAGVPEGDAWLSREERAAQAQLHSPKRRSDWRLGRFAAKRASRRWLGGDKAAPSLASISIVADEVGAPRIEAAGSSPELGLSLSHRGGWALAVVGNPPLALGCDLELVEARTPAFRASYFCLEERRMLDRAAGVERDRLANLLWSAKESALKLQRRGLSVDTRSLEVQRVAGIAHGGWRALRVLCARGPALFGWWRREADRLATVVTAPRRALPEPLLSDARSSCARPEPARLA